MSINPDDSIPNSKARSIAFPAQDLRRANLLAGPPDSGVLRSGYVRLHPGESIGLHSTHEGEEIIIPISGIGELRIPGYETLPVAPGSILYNPPETEHDVVNTGCEMLEYLYIFAKPAEKAD
jgi:mannose-6-phosphate isomerase-like protein (cupin superfamily)